MSDGMRILVLGDSRSFHIERYLVELRRQGYEVLLASLETGTIEYYQLEWKGPFRKLHYRLAVPEIKSLIENFKPDVVDAHFASGYGHIAALALKQSSIPLVVQLWGSDILIVPQKSFLHKKKTITALKRADAVVADSKFLLSEAAKLYPSKLGIVEAFGIEERYLEYFRADGELSRPVKVIVPRPHEKVYNNLFVLRSLGELLKAGTVTVTFPDFGTLLEEFKREVRKLDCPGVSFYSKLERDLFIKFLAGHDLYLSASISDSSPVSLIEAMAIGLIPVVSDLPGVKEWADEGSAYLFALDSPDALGDAVKKVILDRANHSQLRQKNCERVRQAGIFENNVQARINLMKQLIGKL